MKQFSNQDIITYYDRTEPHYKIWWKMNDSMGLHYGLWDKGIKKLPDAIMNMNVQLAKLGEVKKAHHVLDAGCGIGGSSIYLAKNIGCTVIGITLSEKQVRRATANAGRHGVQDRVTFKAMDYTATSFPDNTFDIVWGIESIQTAGDKAAFFKEAARILKPGGRVLMADVFKSYAYNIDEQVLLQKMINGWAMSDLLTLEQLHEAALPFGLKPFKDRDITKEVYPSVLRLLLIAFPGTIGTWLYMVYRRTHHFAEKHYETCFAQYFAYRKKLWKYRLASWQKQ
ncbi:MAG: methyltransferase domain-containing protein [Ignavibacteriales bacterium]|nr:methyltransferase domain-containing protein [Ignavibacteriales bacterium]